MQLRQLEYLVTVADTGNWRPPRGENRGRGLTIIETATDEFEINTSERGTEIVMRRRIIPGEAER